MKIMKSTLTENFLSITLFCLSLSPLINAPAAAQRVKKIYEQNRVSISGDSTAGLKNNKPAVKDLVQCYKLALERNIGLKQAQNLINTNVIDHRIAQNSLLPSAYYNLGHYFSFGKNIDPVSNNFVFQRFSGGYTSVTLQTDVFKGFSRLNTIKQSVLLLQSAEYAKKTAELELLTNITILYARLLSDKEELNAQRDNIKSTERQLDVINEKVKVGRSTKYEGYLFSSRYHSELSNVISLQNDSALTVQDFRELLNIPYQQSFEIAPVDATMLSNILAKNIITSETLDATVQKHPAIKQAEMEEQAARLGERIAKANYYPILTVGGNVASNYNANQRYSNGGKIPLTTQINDNLGQNIYVSLHVPIFSQLENKNKINKEKINISNAELATQQAKNAIVTNTLQIINDFNSAKETYTANLNAWELNNLSYTLYEEKYKLGQISSLEVLNARDLLNTYTTKYIQAKLQLYFQYQLFQLLMNE